MPPLTSTPLAPPAAPPVAEGARQPGGSPPRKPGRALRRHPWLRWVLGLVLGPLAFYLVVMNVLLNLPILAKLIDPPDGSAKISWSWGYTLFPGSATAKNFYLTVEDDNMQFGLRLETVSFWCVPWDLAHQVFHMTTVSGDGVVVRMRFRKSAETYAAMGPEGIANLPDLAGFAELALTRTKSAPFDGNTDGIWTVKADSVLARAREIWIEGVRYDGTAVASGRFTLKPNTLVDVDARLAITGGQVTLDRKRMAGALKGELIVREHPFNPYYEPGARPMRYLQAQLSLEGELQNARFLNGALRGTTAPAFSSSPGHFALFGRFDRGRLAPGTELRLRAPDWQLARGNYQAGGNYARLDAVVTGEPGAPHGEASVTLGPYEVDDPAAGELIEGEGMAVRLSTDRLDLLDNPLSDLGFEVQVDAARMPDLKIINTFLPKSQTFEVLSGTGVLSGAYTSPSEGAGHGNLTLEASAATLRLGQVRLVGDLAIDAQLLGVDSTTTSRALVGRDVFEGSATAKGRFALSDLAVSKGALANFDASAEIVLHPLKASEAGGVQALRYLSGELKIAGNVPSLAFLDGSLAPAGFQLAGGAGQLELDARLSHGVLGRASRLRYAARAFALSGHGLQLKGSFGLESTVDETSETPRAHAAARLEGLVLSDTHGELLRLHRAALTGESPEVNFEQLGKLRPEAALTVDQILLPQLSALNGYLAGALGGKLRFSGGQASAQVRAHSPASGLGSAEVIVQADRVRGQLSDLQFEGNVQGNALGEGLGAAPWEQAVLSRSSLSGHAAVHGGLHLTMQPSGKEGGRLQRSSGHLSFSAEGELPTLAPGRPTGADLLQALRANGRVNGAIDSLAYLDRYLGAGRVRLQEGPLTLAAEASFDHGSVGEGSHVRLDAPNVGVAVGPFWLSGPAHVAAALGDGGFTGPAQAEATIDRLTLESRFRERQLATGGRVHAAIKTKALDPATLVTVSSYDAEADDLSVSDLQALSAYLPDVKDVHLVAGSASASISVHHPGPHLGVAAVQLSSQQLSLLLGDKPVTADLDVKASLRAPNLTNNVPENADTGSGSPGDTALTDQAVGSSKGNEPRAAGQPVLDSLDLTGSTLAITHANFPRDRDWSLSARVVRGDLRLGDSVGLSSDLEVDARDLLPVVHLYGSGLGIPDFLDGLLAFQHLRASAAVEVLSSGISVPAFDAKGDGIEFQGRVALRAKHTAGDFLLGVGPLSLGLDVRDKHTGVQLLGAGSWYRRKLRTPLE